MPQGWRNESARHGLAAKGVKTGRKITKTPIQMNPKLVPMWNAIEDIDSVREALKKDNLFFRSLVDAKVQLKNAVDNAAEGRVLIARKNLAKATDLLNDVRMAPDISRKWTLRVAMESAITEIALAEMKLGEV
jgi:hypothetical protein